MKGKIIEATNGPENPFNWGKFIVMRPDIEWYRRSVVSGLATPLLREIGWGPECVIVYDLQTNEGATFAPRPGACAQNDLKKHRVHVCVLFEAFLVWLYQQDLTELDALPDHVDLPDVPAAMYGYRRPGVLR